jgi:DNA topoisomerase VI subunit A
MRRLLVELTFAVRSEFTPQEIWLLEEDLSVAVNGFIDIDPWGNTLLQYLRDGREGIRVLTEEEPV